MNPRKPKDENKKIKSVSGDKKMNETKANRILTVASTDIQFITEALAERYHSKFLVNQIDEIQGVMTMILEGIDPAIKINKLTNEDREMLASARDEILKGEKIKCSSLNAKCSEMVEDLTSLNNKVENVKESIAALPKSDTKQKFSNGLDGLSLSIVGKRSIVSDFQINVTKCETAIDTTIKNINNKLNAFFAGNNSTLTRSAVQSKPQPVAIAATVSVSTKAKK